MSNYRTHFQDHHSIEQQTLRNSLLLGKMQDAGKFDIHSPENRLFLPASPQFAHEMGITPHSGGPLAEYQKGMLAHLNDLQGTRDGKSALLGDPGALDRVVLRVEQLRDTVKVGLINGDLNTNTPVGQTAALTNQKVQDFFRNIPAYQQTHAQQIEVLKSFKGADHGWSAITHSESRIVTTLEQIHVDGRPLTRGGDIELQRNGLSLAIANAHHDGRVVISEPGIRRVELVLGEESAYRIRVPPSQQGAVSLQLLMGEASARTLVRSGGLLATGADAVVTTRRAADLLEQGNATAAQSELNHALARNAGGWLGGAAAAYLAGTGGFAPVALVAADALLMSKAFEKGADLLDNRRIYQQTDTAGVQWRFAGRNWERQAVMDRTADGVDNPARSSVGATYEKARELGAYASAAAVALALGNAPIPQDPFRLAARPADRRGLDNADWQRDPLTERWSRQVKVGVSGANDRGIYLSEVASPERSRELNQQALARIEGNIAHGHEAIAAAYLENFAALRMHDYIPIPSAVQAARARPEVVQGSDNQRYQRNEAGQWLHDGQPAQGNLALELELTRHIRQPSLERSEQAVAELRAQPAPTAAQRDQHELLHRYQSVGTRLNPEWQQAIALATERTRQAHGLGAGTLQELQAGPSGRPGADSPIVHYRMGADGVARRVAVTRTEDLHQAWNEIRARQAYVAPLPDTPQMQLTPLSPQQREVYAQALREANRQGVSTQEAQQSASDAAANLHGPQLTEPRALQEAQDLQWTLRRTATAANMPVSSETAAHAAIAAQAATAIQMTAPSPAQTQTQTQLPAATHRPSPSPALSVSAREALPHETPRHEPTHREPEARPAPPQTHAQIPVAPYRDVPAALPSTPATQRDDLSFSTPAHTAVYASEMSALHSAQQPSSVHTHARPASGTHAGWPLDEPQGEQHPLRTLATPAARRYSGLLDGEPDAYRRPSLARPDAQRPSTAAALPEASWEEITRTMRALRIRLEQEMQAEDRLAQVWQTPQDRSQRGGYAEAEPAWQRRHGLDDAPALGLPPWQAPDAAPTHPAGPQNDRLLPVRRTITGDRDVDDLLYAIDSKNDVAIEQALKRINTSAYSVALAQQGHAQLDARALHEAQQQAAACQTPGMDMPVEVETRRGPVRVLTLPQFAHDPAQQGGPQGDGGGDGG